MLYADAMPCNANGMSCKCCDVHMLCRDTQCYGNAMLGGTTARCARQNACPGSDNQVLSPQPIPILVPIPNTIQTRNQNPNPNMILYAIMSSTLILILVITTSVHLSYGY